MNMKRNSEISCSLDSILTERVVWNMPRKSQPTPSCPVPVTSWWRGSVWENLEHPSQFGVKVLERTEDEEGERACWSRCCETDGCDLAVISDGTCHLVRCNVKGFNMCELSEQEGARTFRRPDAGAQPTLDAPMWVVWTGYLSNFCLPQKETGPCRAYFVRWWYDAESETCKNFTYGGCPVNLNNHAGEEECMNKCQGVKGVQHNDTEAPHSEPIRSAATVPEFCSGPGVTGNCRAAFTRWYYDVESQSCQMFIYGGCGGSTNNHISEQDCMAKCTADAPKPEPAKVHSPEKGDFKEDDDEFADHSVVHHSLSAVVLPILLALLAAILIGVMILFFVKVTKRNQETAGFRAMWNPIDDKECLMNSAYTL
ncbi:unnamed protein product [Ranitomeya imitator]|uniref:BPTI/Kunitz inhibitor domain-containing protein n=1 Tax=Ranitomeya imitator TaxID=111125 RepID=A0ABN9LHT2_9NEOB|nr:unnamed protein product [Ranitomeya imitator]